MSHLRYEQRRQMLLLAEIEVRLLAVAAMMVEEEEEGEAERQQTERRIEIVAAAARRRRRHRQQKIVWVREWLLRRPLYGQYEKLMDELRTEDKASFRNFMRMEPELFTELLQRVGPRIQKQDTFFRKALEPGLKLAVTMRYLATGDSYKSLSYSFRVGANTICNFVPEVCKAITEEYSSEVMTCPTTPEAWKEVADVFKNRWNLPHCVGAIDGKHVAIRKPKKSGSYYYNYKHFFSIVMLAVVDADYKFLYVDIGANGAGSDAGIFNDTELKQALEDDKIGLPPPEPLPHDDQPIAYFIVADDAFALKTWMMKPLPIRNMSVNQRIFNYRLSRARRVVENVFGILASRFRCLLGTMPQSPQRVTDIALTCCVLHNLLRLRNANNADIPVDHDADHNHDEANLPDNPTLHDMQEVYRGNANRAAKLQREYLIHYFNSEVGSVPWQQDMI